MKNSFNKAIALLLIAVMLITAFAACNKPDVPVDNSPAPTEQQADVPTEEPTTEPTEEATEIPTAEPTVAPTEVPTEAPLPEDPEAIGDCVKDAEVLAYLPFGEEETCMGFAEPGEDEGAPHMPEAFCMDGNRIYILDNVKKRIVVYESGDLSFIPFSDQEDFCYATSLAVIENKIYVGEARGRDSILAVYDMDGQRLGKIPMPYEGPEKILSRLISMDGRLIMINSFLEFYELTDDKFDKLFDVEVKPVGQPEFTIRFRNTEIQINTGENTIPSIYSIAGEKVYCRVIGYNPNIPAPHDEISYRVYDSEGTLLGATVVDRRRVIGYPASGMFVSDDGEVFVMTCMQDGIYITKPNLRTEYVSHLGESAESGN